MVAPESVSVPYLDKNLKKINLTLSYNPKGAQFKFYRNANSQHFIHPCSEHFTRH